MIASGRVRNPTPISSVVNSMAYSSDSYWAVKSLLPRVD